MSALLQTTATDYTEQMTRVLFGIPADLPRAEWVKCLAAARAAGLSADLCQAWSAQDPRFNEADFRAAWRSAQPKRVSAASLVWIARQFGFKDHVGFGRPSAEHMRKLAEQMRQAEEAEQRRHLEVAKQCYQRWKSADRADPHHPYLQRKRLAELAPLLRQEGSLLLVPLTDWRRSIWSLQTITPGGTKLYTAGSRTKGAGFHIRGGGNTTLLCEGVATGLSLHAATGAAVVCAMSASNMPTIAASLKRSEQSRLLIVADHDRSGTGQRAAQEAARAIKAPWCMPSTTGEDASDLWLSGGSEAVLAMLEGARYE